MFKCYININETLVIGSRRQEGLIFCHFGMKWSVLRSYLTTKETKVIDSGTLQCHKNKKS